MRLLTDHVAYAAPLLLLLLFGGATWLSLWSEAATDDDRPKVVPRVRRAPGGDAAGAAAERREAALGTPPRPSVALPSDEHPLHGHGLRLRSSPETRDAAWAE